MPAGDRHDQAGGQAGAGERALQLRRDPARAGVRRAEAGQVVDTSPKPGTGRHRGQRRSPSSSATAPRRCPTSSASRRTWRRQILEAAGFDGQGGLRRLAHRPRRPGRSSSRTPTADSPLAQGSHGGPHRDVVRRPRRSPPDPERHDVTDASASPSAVTRAAREPGAAAPGSGTGQRRRTRDLGVAQVAQAVVRRRGDRLDRLERPSRRRRRGQVGVASRPGRRRRRRGAPASWARSPTPR